ncbi:type II toxin-antitoxin system mRNA interferase toxin, RelE/StbE family [uncultured Helicobacter sp.]|uniref:type II toxin-antitoxin system mRNA interferase toxin, RelE/StbE family n=1 Tax=uncultured Helicobacter sp. TaxID=175537 RepID=UPI00374F8B9D
MTGLEVKYSKLFKKDLKRYKHKPQSLTKAKEVIHKLANNESLESKHRGPRTKGRVCRI